MTVQAKSPIFHVVCGTSAVQVTGLKEATDAAHELRKSHPDKPVYCTRAYAYIDMRGLWQTGV